MEVVGITMHSTHQSHRKSFWKVGVLLDDLPLTSLCDYLFELCRLLLLRCDVDLQSSNRGRDVNDT